jgi:NADH-quinone oxidoreductase subunit L
VFISVAAGLIGIGLAYFFYVLAPAVPEVIARAAGGLYMLVYNKYFVDELYDAAVVHPLRDGSRSVLWHGVDENVLDRTVNAVGRRARNIGGALKMIQSGYIRSYAAWVVLGALVVIAAISFAGGVR